jgi:transcriptional regulator with XRE-family HTH domain
LVRESPTVENARRDLGAKLAACRRAAGHSQAALATLTGYSRSTVANVETGRQHVPADFWETADAACHAEGALIQASDQVEAAARRERLHTARQVLLVPTGDPGADGARPLVQAGGSGAEVAGPLMHPAGGILQVAGHGDGGVDLIAAAAAEARGHAEQASVTGIGPGTVEQFTADVARLSRAYVTAPPLPLFAAMHRELALVQAALDRKLYPDQARELNFLAGALCALMANASLDVGREEAADDFAYAAWTYARIIDDAPLMAWARGTQALAAILDQRHPDAVRHTEAGLIDAPAGISAARLHAIHARALANCGEPAEARVAITAAHADDGHDELHDGVGGEFAFDEAKLAYYEAMTLLGADDPAAAEHVALAAVGLYQAVPERVRSYGCEALAKVELAKAQLLTGKLDDAAQALGGVLALDPARRISSLNQHLQACRNLLHDPAHHNSATAQELDRELSTFSAGSTAALVLPGRR